MTKIKTDWTLIAGKSDYSWNGWKAKYLRTDRGLGVYKTFRPDGSVYGIGGLPAFVSI